MLRPFVFVLAAGAMSSVPARAQTVGTLFINRSVMVDGAERMAAALKAIGAGIGHNARDNAYHRADVFTWLFQQRR
ncbi:MAG: hypothetical protein ABIS06_13220 [Vicinamibacterales bacterium]